MAKLQLHARRKRGRGHGRVAPVELDPAEEQRFPELAAALTSGRASFDTYLRARFLAEERFNPDDHESRALYGRSRAVLFDAYQRDSGRVCSSYYCGHVVAGAARTDHPRMALVFNSGTWGPEEQLLTSCDGLYWEAIDHVRGSERATFVERLYAVTTDVLALLDARCRPPDQFAPGAPAVTQQPSPAAEPERQIAGSDAARSDALEALRRKLADVKAFYMQAAPKRARLTYLAGVAYGVVGTGCLAGLLFLLLWFTNVFSADVRVQLLCAFAAGGLGAVLSVLQRVNSERLQPNYEAGRRELHILGMVRPLIGALGAVAVYALLVGGILDFALPETAVTEVFYYVGIGFISGFSERFAPDTLLRTASQLGGDSSGTAQPTVSR